MAKVIIQQVSEKDSPILYSQVLNLRNQLLRQPIGLDLFQEDLSQEVNHVTLAAITTTSTPAKSNDNSSRNNPEEIDTDKNKDEEGISLIQDSHKQELSQEKVVVGCIIVAPVEGDEKTFKVRQMAVSPNFQGQGIGAKLLQSIEDYTKRHGKSRLYLHARAHAVGFYRKSGYSQLTEKEFLELGIPHHAMEKIL